MDDTPEEEEAIRDTNHSEEPERPAAGRAWVASDATYHEFYDEENDVKNKSEIAIAIAVDDRNEFNTEYRHIIEEKAESYGFSPKRPVLKAHGIRTNASEWQYDEIIADFVEDLLSISNIQNIHVTISTITNQLIDAYTEDSGPCEQLSRDALHNEITNYYHLIAIWDYLEEYRDAPWGTANVLLDDFEGKDNDPWRRIGMISDSLNIIPRGDYTYPILSLADLTMDYLKDNVEEWTEKEIEETLIDVTPDDSAFVNTKGIHTPAKFEEIVPLTRNNISRGKHYPHPIVFIDRGGMDREEFMQYDLYHIISEYVYENSGCMKYFERGHDGKILQSKDYIVCLSDSASDRYENVEKYNESDQIVLSPDEAFEALD